VSDYPTLLRKTYLDEARGDAFFGELESAQPDAQRREKLRTLQTVEARTATSLRRLLADAGLKVDDARARQEGRELAGQVDAADWNAVIRELRGSFRHESAAVDQVRAAAPRPDDPAITALANHARAIERFVELESTGAAEQSLRALTDHLRRPA